MNILNTLALRCGNRICIGLPGTVGAMLLPGIRQNSSRFVVWKLLHLSPKPRMKKKKQKSRESEHRRTKWCVSTKCSAYINHCLNPEFSSFRFLHDEHKKHKLNYSFWREINRQKKKVISKRIFSRLRKERKQEHPATAGKLYHLHTFQFGAYGIYQPRCCCAMNEIIRAGKFAGRLNFNRLMVFTDLIGYQMAVSFIKTN